MDVATGARLRRGLGAAALFALGLFPGLLVLGVLQHAMYGSALANGYGPPSALFASSHLAPNLARYPRWLLETHTPFLALALAAPMVRRGQPSRGAQVWLCLALALGTVACYLPYSVFDDWWYIRFLLPAIPLLMVLSVVVLVALLRRVASRWHRALTAISVVTLALWYTHEAREHLAFALRDMEHHFVEAGTFVAERLPERAVIVTVKYSGSVHFFAGRPTLGWDAIDPSGLEPAFTFLRDHGYEPYLLRGDRGRGSVQSAVQPRDRDRRARLAADRADRPCGARLRSKRSRAISGRRHGANRGRLEHAAPSVLAPVLRVPAHSFGGLLSGCPIADVKKRS